MKDQAPCPCCSGVDYASCCAPFHRAVAEPPVPLALMRSRYSAFALKQVDHLWRTLHSTHPDRALPRGDVIRALKRMCNRSTFPRLEIVSTEEPNAAGDAFVTFRAGILEGSQEVGFVERSLFRQESGAWRYVSGTPSR